VSRSSPSLGGAEAREPQPPAQPAVEAEPSTEALTAGEPPRIYVASLADYNAGRLHGVWLDAAVPVDKMQEAVTELLARSPLPDAEEWAIHDHSGFGHWRLGEYEDLSVVAAVAAGVIEHGAALTSWVDYLGSAEEGLRTFEEAYLGNWTSMSAYLDQLIEDIGLDITVEPESWKQYISVDTDLVIADLEHQLYVIERADGSVDLFNPNVG
jgi:antirestriction protein